MRFFVPAALTAANFMASQAGATTFLEPSTDTGNTVTPIEEAIVLPVGTTEVIGTIGPDDNDTDLYRFTVVEDALVELLLDMDPNQPPFADANLLLFNGIGNPIEGDDDGAVDTLDSLISIFLSAGEYLVAVGDNNMAGYDASRTEIIDNDQGLCALNSNCNENGILSFVAAETPPELDFGPGEPGILDYRLTITGAGAAPEVNPIPLPATGWMLLAAVGAGAMARRKR
ncbi:MAG: DVUA0089 family protein [Pseudomonadota bacterium]